MTQVEMNLSGNLKSILNLNIIKQPTKVVNLYDLGRFFTFSSSFILLPQTDMFMYIPFRCT